MRTSHALPFGFGLLAAALLLAVPAPANAQDWTSIRGIRVVVQVRGKNKRNRERVGRAIRRRIVEAVGPLVPSRELDAAKKKLKLKGKRSSNPRNLARAGLKIGAEHVIDVYVKTRGRNAEIRSRLIDVATAEIAFESVTPVKRLRQTAKRHGKAIGDELIAKLEAITQAYGGSVSAPPSPSATVLPEATITAKPTAPDATEPADVGAPFSGSPDAAPRPPPPPPATSSDPYAGIDDPGAPTGEGDGVKWFSSGGAVETAPPARPNNTESNVTNTNSAPPPPSNTATFTPTQPLTTTREFVRIGMGAGAGLLRSYTLATNEGSSSLSYTLDPLSMFAFDFELIVPKIDAGLELSATFRPVAYSVNRGSLGTAFPSGLLIDFGAALTYHAEVWGEGREAFRIIPSLGARVVVQNVEQHDGNIIPSATAFAMVVGATARYPINEVIELDGGADLGLVLSYSETPLGSGDSNGGFTFSLRAGARVWMTPYLGITFDNTLQYDAIAFSNAPERPLPPDERGRLTDLSLDILDVRTSVGVVFRF